MSLHFSLAIEKGRKKGGKKFKKKKKGKKKIMHMQTNLFILKLD